jgi:hypothetical protein
VEQEDGEGEVVPEKMEIAVKFFTQGDFSHGQRFLH